MNGQPRRRATALLEVLAVYLPGRLVSYLLVRLAGVSFTNPNDNWSARMTNDGLITASRQMFVWLMFLHAGYFLLISRSTGGIAGEARRPIGLREQAAPGRRCW